MALLKDLIVQGPARFLTDIYGPKFIVNGATSSQFLKGDGSLDTNEYGTKVTVVNSSTLPSTLEPNKVYNLGTLTGTVTIPAFASVDANDDEVKIWCFTFNTSTTAPTITWPVGITAWSGGVAPLIGVSMKYEVSVMNGLGIVIES